MRTDDVAGQFQVKSLLGSLGSFIKAKRGEEPRLKHSWNLRLV